MPAQIFREEAKVIIERLICCGSELTKSEYRMSAVHTYLCTKCGHEVAMFDMYPRFHHVAFAQPTAVPAENVPAQTPAAAEEKTAAPAAEEKTAAPAAENIPAQTPAATHAETAATIAAATCS